MKYVLGIGKKPAIAKRTLFTAALCSLLLVSVGVYLFYRGNKSNVVIQSVADTETIVTTPGRATRVSRINPLKGKKFYVDDSTKPAILARNLRLSGDTGLADLASEVAAQPRATWLIGPNDSDPTAERDFIELSRTSEEARTRGEVPIYELYAIPDRDACATYSGGGFARSSDYIVWLERILRELKTEAVFSVEADAVGHAATSGCLGEQAKQARYELLTQAMKTLSESPKVIGLYLDAAHSEWFPEPSLLVEPLRRSGVIYADGLAVNVSNYVATSDMVDWSKELTQLLGGDLGVIIDTSRNGRGSPAADKVGEQRWCNPSGRGLGNIPTTETSIEHVDAYVWIKVPGESDGSCFGYPEAGVFVPDIAYELARNSLE